MNSCKFWEGEEVMDYSAADIASAQCTKVNAVLVITMGLTSMVQ